LRIPGVGFVLKKPGVGVSDVLGSAREDNVAFVEFVISNPSGYSSTGPGRANGGWTGPNERLWAPQLPTQNDEASFISSQMPSYGTFWYHSSSSLVQKSLAFG
jgi:hypothetical protein